MYINAVLSFLGAWHKLQQEHREILEEIQRALADADFSGKGPLNYKLQSVFTRELTKSGWQEGLERPSAVSGYSSISHYIGFVKNKVGLDYWIIRDSGVLIDIFAKYPLFIQARLIETVIVLMSGSESPLAKYERVCDQLRAFAPLPLKYPFAICSISNTFSPIDVQELTSDLDVFLIASVGFSLGEMRLLTEQPQFDFKERFPEGKDFAELAAALANLHGGGVVLLGVDNQGNVTGLSRGQDLDDLSLRITNVIQDTCKPRPHFALHVFDDPSDTSRCVLAVRIHEIEYKPCIVREKVYIRVGSSTRAAGPDEIRRLVLG